MMANSYLDVPLTKIAFDEDEINELRNVFSSGWVAGQGPASDRFARAVEESLNVKHALPLNNCTAGLHLALISLGVGSGDEVIVSDYTYPATGHAVAYTGATPIFADVERDTFNTTAEEIERLITPRTKAVIVVHTFGNPCDMDAILRTTKTNGLRLIEDCACSLGASYGGRKTGTFGDVACFSLHARKGITTGEGGIAVTDNTDIYEMMKKYSCFGVESAYSRQTQGGLVVPEFSALGFNYKMSDICAGIGVAQLRKLPLLAKQRKELAERYRSRLDGLALTPQKILAKGESALQAFVCLTEARDELVNFLRASGVQAQIGTFSSFVQPVYKSEQSCPISLDVFKKSIALPFFPGLSEREEDFIFQKIREFFDAK